MELERDITDKRVLGAPALRSVCSARRGGSASEAEQHIGDLLQCGSFDAATTVAISVYGPEVYGFLIATLRDESEAHDVFAHSCECLWKALPEFDRSCSVRTCFYTLARRAALHSRRSSRRRTMCQVPRSRACQLSALAHTRTLPCMRTQLHDGFKALRESLSQDEHSLLVLRVDRALRWREVARVFAPGELSREDLTRLTARLRKRFQALRAQLQKRAHETGLLPREDS